MGTKNLIKFNSHLSSHGSIHRQTNLGIRFPVKVNYNEFRKGDCPKTVYICSLFFSEGLFAFNPKRKGEADDV